MKAYQHILLTTDFSKFSEEVDRVHQQLGAVRHQVEEFLEALGSGLTCRHALPFPPQPTVARRE